MSELKGIHYDAFISYRHSEMDSFVAQNLHRKLENFKLPKSIASKVRNGKTKITRIFRDVDELPLSDNLSDPINDALLNSDFLITICTPRYPESKWCLKEIETFIKMHDREHVLVVLAEGEPLDSFPEILTYEEYTTINENGESITEKREMEPLAADTRGENKKEILKAMDTAVLKLAAAMFGLNFDDLKQRHREQKIRRMITVFGSIGAAVLAFAVFATAMLIKISHQNNIISGQYAELEDKYAGSMAMASETLLGKGARKDAVYAAKSVLPDIFTAPNTAALHALYDAMNVFALDTVYWPVDSYGEECAVSDYRVSFDGRYILEDDLSSLKVFDKSTEEEILSIPYPESDSNAYLYDYEFCADEGVAVVSDEESRYYSLSSDKSFPLDGLSSDTVLFSSDDGKVTLAFDEDIVSGLDPEGNIIFTTDVSDLVGDDFLTLDTVSFHDGLALLCLTGMDTQYIILLDEMTGLDLVDIYEDGDSLIASTLDEEDIIYSRSEPGGFCTVAMMNAATGADIWRAAYRDIAPKKLTVHKDRLFLNDEYTVAVLDKKDGSVVNLYNSDTQIIESWADDKWFYIMLTSGEVKIVNDDGVFDHSSSFFGAYVPSDDVFSARHCAKTGDLYVLFDSATYVTRYAPDMIPEAEKVSYEYTTLYTPEKDAFNDVIDSGALRESEIDFAFYSNDEKYIFVHLANRLEAIYEATDMECISTFDIRESTYNELKASDITGGYILNTYYNTYYLNDDFEIYANSSRVVGEEGDKLIIMNDDNDFYKIPFTDYEDLMKKADEYLKDYVPSDKTRTRYGIR